MHCMTDLVDNITENDGEFPDAVAIHDEAMGERHPMHRYMEIAWKAVSFEILGDEIPMTYEVVT